jgi:hypothetical protein
MQTLKRLLRFFEHLLVTWTYIRITVVEDKTKFTKIMLPILKYSANNGFRELFLRHNGVTFLTIL